MVDQAYYAYQGKSVFGIIYVKVFSRLSQSRNKIADLQHHKNRLQSKVSVEINLGLDHLTCQVDANILSLED